MRYVELLDQVRRAGVPEPVELAVAAVLTTLGEELPAGTAGYLASNLPTEVGVRVRRAWPTDDAGARMDRYRFLYRVAQRGGCDPEEAGPRIRAVLGAVSEGVPEAVMVDVAVAVPEDLLDLMPPIAQARVR
jgi:uncharacterized protein (DUF2267 family)